MDHETRNVKVSVTTGRIDAMPVMRANNKVLPRGRRDDMPTADGSSTVAKIAADLQLYVRPRTGPQSAHL